LPVTGREGSVLLPLAGIFAVLLTLGLATPGLSFVADLLTVDCGFEDGLSLEFPSGRSAGRGDGLGESLLGRDGFSGTESVRAALSPPERNSSSAFRLG
jgi:hypothetical protein